jgi:DNA-binding transcriptional LysR family regulator
MRQGRLIELEAAVAVARRRSFRAAATEVGLSPTALSQVIAELEKRLGVRLFNRTTRSVAPTEAGEQFIAEVAPALASIRSSMEAVNRHRESPTGTLRINTSSGAARQIMTPLILEYLRRYPEMAIDIVTEGKLVDVVKDGFDAGIRLAETVPADMIAVPLGMDEQMVAVASPAYLKRRGIPKLPEDLMHHDCIRARLASGGIYRWEFARRGKQRAIDVPGRITLDDMDLIQEAAVAGFGIAYLWLWRLRDSLQSGQLVQILEDWTPPFPGLCLYYPRGRHVPAGTDRSHPREQDENLAPTPPPCPSRAPAGRRARLRCAPTRTCSRG